MTGKICNIAHLVNEQNLESVVTEPPVTLLVRQAFAFCYKISVSPFTVTFESKSGRYVSTGGSKFKKVLCLILVALTWIKNGTLMSLSTSSSEPGNPPNRADVVMNKLLGFAYFTFLITFHWTLFSRMEAVVKVLNQIVEFMGRIDRGTEPKWASKQKVQIMFGVIIGLCIFMSMSGTLSFLGNGSIRKSMLELIKDTVDMEARVALMLFSHGNVTTSSEYRFSACAPTAVTILFAAVSTVWLFWAMFCWTCGYCILVATALSICLALASLHDKIKQKTIGTAEEIRMFSYMVKIVENLNGIYGWAILFSVFAGVMHFSVNLVTIFRLDRTTLEQSLCVLNLGWFGGTLWATAQVYEESMKIGRNLRLRFEEEQSWSQIYYGINSGYRNEATDMLLLIHQELNAQNVGLKGHGLFTCSYGFVGTVLGMISTYSVIVIQSQTESPTGSALLFA